METSSSVKSRCPNLIERGSASVYGKKLGDTRLLEAHCGAGQNALNDTQYAKCPHCPSRNIKLRKSNEADKRSDEKWNDKENPALRPLAGLYRVAAIRTHRSGTNKAAPRQRKLVPLRSAL